MDKQIFLWINNWPEAWSGFITFFSYATNLLFVKILLLALIIAMLIKGPKPRMAVLAALIGVGIANPLTDLAKHFLPTHRPFQPEELGNLVHLRVGYANSMGTASAHTANMTAVAVAMMLTLGPWGWPWVVIALLTAVSRIYVGAHYPSQVLLGAIIGGLAGWVAVLLVRRVSEFIRSRSKSGEEAKTTD